jgi:hypothetical protein
MMNLASIPTKNSCRHAEARRPRRTEPHFAGIAAQAALLYAFARILAQHPGNPEEKQCGFRVLEFPAPTL